MPRILLQSFETGLYLDLVGAWTRGFLCDGSDGEGKETSAQHCQAFSNQ
jgi:hypothetical protein